MGSKNKPVWRGFLSPIIPAVFCLLYIAIGPSYQLGKLSAFPYLLSEPPELWWPITFWPTAILLVVWAVISLFAQVSFRASSVITGVLFSLALLFDALGGVALYKDKIVTRDLRAFSFEPKILELRDVTRIELSCDKSTRNSLRRFNRSLKSTADYKIIFDRYTTIDLTDGLTSKRDHSDWINYVSQLDSKVSSMQIPRVLRAGENIDIYSKCLGLFRSEFSTKQRETYFHMFSPDTQ